MNLSTYVARFRQFETLIPYLNSKAPVYRMRDRLKADNFFPNNALAENLAQVDALRKTVVSDLLD